MGLRGWLWGQVRNGGPGHRRRVKRRLAARLGDAAYRHEPPARAQAQDQQPVELRR